MSNTNRFYGSSRIGAIKFELNNNKTTRDWAICNFSKCAPSGSVFKYEHVVRRIIKLQTKILTTVRSSGAFAGPHTKWRGEPGQA